MGVGYEPLKLMMLFFFLKKKIGVYVCVLIQTTDSYIENIELICNTEDSNLDHIWSRADQDVIFQ